MSDLQIKSIIERILRLHAEEDELKADRREVYGEAKANGYDKTALGMAVKAIRNREKDAKPEAVERSAMVDLYLSAYDGEKPHVGARDSNRRANNKTPTPAPLTAVQDEAAAGAIPDQEADDTASRARAVAIVAKSAPFVAPAGTGEGIADPTDPVPAADGLSSLARASAIAAGVVGSQTPRVVLSHVEMPDIPAFLRRTRETEPVEASA